LSVLLWFTLLITTLISSNLSFSLVIGTCDINEINEIDNAKFCEHYTFTMNYLFVCLVVFNATFNNISVISWLSVLLVEETRGPWENHRPVASHWQTLSHNVVHFALIAIRIHNNSSCGDR
jgi:hypothetical protein